LAPPASRRSSSAAGPSRTATGATSFTTPATPRSASSATSAGSRALTSRSFFRHRLSKLLKVHLKFRGYFDLSNIPFEYISLFDFSDKKNPFQADDLNVGPSIFDHLEERGIPCHVSDPTRTERQSLDTLLTDITAEKIVFAWL
jgi:hypothetical protein